jgi:hypothetical protein
MAVSVPTLAGAPSPARTSVYRTELAGGSPGGRRLGGRYAAKLASWCLWSLSMSAGGHGRAPFGADRP